MASAAAAEKAPARLFDVKGMGGKAPNGREIKLTGAAGEIGKGGNIPKGASVKLTVWATVVEVGHRDDFETADGVKFCIGATRVHKARADSVNVDSWSAPDDGLRFDGQHVRPYHDEAAAKGEAPADDPAVDPAGEADAVKPLGKMSKAELIEVAEVECVDLAGAKSNADRIAAIELGRVAPAEPAPAEPPAADFAPIPADPDPAPEPEPAVTLPAADERIAYTEAQLSAMSAAQLRDLLAKHGVPSAAGDIDTLVSMVMTLQE